MTLRGAFDGFSRIQCYRELPKVLKISLLQCTVVWNSLLALGLNDKDMRAEISAYLNHLKDEMDAHSERDVVYMLAMRSRIRVIEIPRYSWLFGNLVVKIVVGKVERPKKIVVPKGYLSAHGLGTRPNVAFTPRAITFSHGEAKLTIPIHTLLLDLQLNLGVNSTVTYVGKTGDPGTRVIDGNHRGLSDTLAIAAENQDDVFLFSNTFHAQHHSSTPDRGMVFIVSNSLINEIAIKPEADLIENLLIYYFEPITQKRSRKQNLGILRNTLIKLRDDKRITAIEMSFEVDDSSEYFRIGNTQVGYAHRHAFICKLVDNELTCDVLPAT